MNHDLNFDELIARVMTRPAIPNTFVLDRKQAVDSRQEAKSVFGQQTAGSRQKAEDSR
jgi:hypothetical protein